MTEYLPSLIEVALAALAFAAGYATLAANLKSAQKELAEHIAASEQRFNEHVAADEARHKEHVLAAVYDLQIRHLIEKLDEISKDLRELKQLIVLPQPIRRDLM